MQSGPRTKQTEQLKREWEKKQIKKVKWKEHKCQNMNELLDYNWMRHEIKMTYYDKPATCFYESFLSFL